MTQVELFGATSCPYTSELREQLLWDDRDFVEHTVDESRAAYDRLVELTGSPNVPALIEDGRVVQVGWQGRTCRASPPEDE